MKTKKDFKTWSVQLPMELYNYLKDGSSKEYTTMSKFLIQILLKHKNNK